MADPICPRCGRPRGRKHSVSVSVRAGSGYATDHKGASITVCESCAVELRDEIKVIIDKARVGII